MYVYRLNLWVRVQEVGQWNPEALAAWLLEHTGEDVDVKRSPKDKRCYLLLLLTFDESLDQFKSKIEPYFQLK